MKKEKFDPTFLKNWLKEKGYSQKEFAKMCNISLSTLQTLLKGESNPRASTMIKLLKTTKVSSVDLFGF